MKVNYLNQKHVSVKY